VIQNEIQWTNVLKVRWRVSMEKTEEYKDEKVERVGEVT
jgi:hypothetical protein